MQLETEIGLARRSRLPVLITAPLDSALKVAEAIVAGGKEERRAVLICDGAAIVDAARDDRTEGRPAGEDVVLLVREVHALSEAEQAALMQLLMEPEASAHRRIITTSSVCLFNRVEQGRFDATLFYRLNTIHIITNHPCGGDVTAAPDQSHDVDRGAD
jgi:hypothetical protein